MFSPGTAPFDRSRSSQIGRGGARTEGEESGRPGAPPVGYLPCRPPRPGSDRVIVELCGTHDGRRVLTVYSSITALVLCRGTRQAWIGIRLDAIAELRSAVCADAVALDLPIPGRTIEHESVRW
ncbi:SAV_915 family protein [Amycolatopsis alkalitolerans]|uniref:SseB family protein n=1 Tax=Amycolatopsis alkalitolerans TaxID=2547244 RepID=A0A5C4M5L7_9PSEU|nr:SAV_915 family protein [Amycolatopsis alkalitolerans]TNC28452.1 hypothetical protein FG385_04000 [Amycolatopsis alkalitolerans]